MYKFCNIGSLLTFQFVLWTPGGLDSFKLHCNDLDMNVRNDFGHFMFFLHDLLIEMGQSFKMDSNSAVNHTERPSVFKGKTYPIYGLTSVLLVSMMNMKFLVWTQNRYYQKQNIDTEQQTPIPTQVKCPTPRYFREGWLCTVQFSHKFSTIFSLSDMH